MNTYRNAAGRLRSTPQSEPLPGREADMARNAAGGFGFKVDAWKQLERFLVLGSEGGTYYVSEDKHTQMGSSVLLSLIASDGERVVEMAADISDKGRALKNDPALFALAMAITKGDRATKQAVVKNLSKVARIPTHLFHFVAFATAGRGWGRALKRAVAGWYQSRDVESLARHITKYPSRDGWSHLDVLRLSRGLNLHRPDQRALYDWVNGNEGGNTRHLVDYLGVVAEVRGLEPKRSNLGRLTALIKQHRLPREVLPTEWLAMPEVWAALADDMPLTALLRNLGNLAKNGVFNDREMVAQVAGRLTDARALQRARIHPLQVLVAAKVYGQGHSVRGGGEWHTTPRIVDALDAAFPLAIQGLAPTGKRFLLALDVSGSMSMDTCTGAPLMPSEAAAAVAVAIARTEQDYDIMGFASTFKDLGIGASTSLTDAMKRTRGLTFGDTDCALPMKWATQHGIKGIDVFLVITDNETWVGKDHVSQALGEYRRKFNPAAKLMVLATSFSNTSIADPHDPYQLDVVGFDGSVGQVIQEFALL